MHILSKRWRRCCNSFRIFRLLVLTIRCEVGHIFIFDIYTKKLSAKITFYMNIYALLGSYILGGCVNECVAFDGHNAFEIIRWYIMCTLQKMELLLSKSRGRWHDTSLSLKGMVKLKFYNMPIIQYCNCLKWCM